MSTTNPPLARTPLYALHRELGARMVPFAGYEMPVQYPSGVLKEHLHTRAQAGLFDVSHMGQLRLRGEKAARGLEALVPVDIVDLPLGMQRYALFTNPAGGILDDLMVTHAGVEEFFLVVNAACKTQDLAYLCQHLGATCTLESLFDSHALLALQGPAAATVLARLAPQAVTMRFMQSSAVDLLGTRCTVSRSGYTGEDGFEISVPNTAAEALARRLLAEPEVAPVGLGARDSLRLEAGLCLYGHDMEANTTPVEASLSWAISKVRRAEGARAGGFPGAEIILQQMRTGTVRKRVGLLPQTRLPVREGTALTHAAGQAAGQVCSGGFGPSINAPVAMAYVPSAQAAEGAVFDAHVRGQAVQLKVARMPFVSQRYYRG